MDVSRIAAGRAPIDLRPLDLRDTLRGTVETVLPLAEAKGIGVRLGVHPSVPVIADPRRLEQVFLNLLSNAVKFTPPGGWVTVDAKVSDRLVDVRVTDNGIGIEPAFLPHVFERFRQAEGTTARTAGGLGLGLFIARQLVEAQGGSMRAESGSEPLRRGFKSILPSQSTRCSWCTRSPVSHAGGRCVEYREERRLSDGVRRGAALGVRAPPMVDRRPFAPRGEHEEADAERALIGAIVN